MRAFSAVFLLSTFSTFVSVAQEAWRDDVKYYAGPVVLTALEGYRTVSDPVAGAKVTGSTEGPARVSVAALVENGGQRFYLTEASFGDMLGDRGAPVWITAGGTEQLPSLPRLVKRAPGEDPDSGEEVMIEVYEETATLQPESRWPAATAVPTKNFPAALLAVGEDADGHTTVDLQLFMNTNAAQTGYPFAQPSFNELSNGKGGALVRLYSRPGTVNVRLLITGPSPVLPLMQPGLVFLAGFAEGALVRLSIGGDAWTEAAPVSRLGAPVFKNDGKLAFGFGATDFTGAKAVTPIRVLPDRIAGADYTQYKLISEMGAPFDEYSPAEFQNAWTLHIERDLTTTLLAPLYDGRGAPGMIELEGLSLDPVPAAATAENISDEVFAAFRDFLPSKTDPAIFGEGWKSILEHKLGEIPAAQRVPETGGGEL